MLVRELFNTELEMFRDAAARFLTTEALPHYAQWENDGLVERSFWNKAGNQGLLAPMVPEEYGGVGLDFRYNAVVIEEAARLGLSALACGWCLHNDIAVPYIQNLGTKKQKEEYLPKCVTGELITAIAMSEPGTGSDLQNVKTTAVLHGDEYVINGSKTFITNGMHADLVIVVCKTDPAGGSKGLSLVLVETGTPGFERGARLEKIGLKAQDTAELFFNDVRVPKSNLLGVEGGGFVHLMEELPQERLTIAVNAMAAAAATLAMTVEYVKERRAFGKPVSAFQNTQFKLAEMDAQVTALQVFLDKCLELHVRGKLDTVTASKVKMLTTELQGRVADECVQLHGGYGVMWEYAVSRAYVDARALRIYGGTNEIMKLIIARSLVGR